MRIDVQSKLQNLIPVILDYLKNNKPNSGVVDVSTIGAQVINCMVSDGVVALSEKNECKQYLCTLIGYSFRNGLPDSILLELYNLMIAENSYNSLASSLSKKI